MLRELQLQMMEALYQGRPDKAASLIAAPKPEARARLNVYRNNVLTNFGEALAASYPVIRRLVGDKYFHQITRAYRLRHASRSGDLQQVGERFPRYLADLHDHGDYRYLADVARLEWLIEEALLSPDAPTLNIAELGHVGPGEQPGLHFKLHPALRLFRSAYPVLRIWEENTDAEHEPDLIDLRSGAEHVVLLRRASTLKLHRLSVGEYQFLVHIESGAAFSTVVDLAIGRDAEFDVAATLQHCVAIGAIVDFE